jgi:dUTPase
MEGTNLSNAPNLAGSPQKKATGVLTGPDIRSLGIISSNSEDSCYKSASYDLRISRDYAESGDHGSQGLIQRRTADNKPIVIPRFGALLVSTLEHVRMPLDVCGRFDLRVSYAYEGLFVQMGTQVEPGYQGPLAALVQNISDQDIEIPYWDLDQSRLFTIEFHILRKPVDASSALVIGSFEELLNRRPMRIAKTLNAIRLETADKIENINKDMESFRESMKNKYEEHRRLTLVDVKEQVREFSDKKLQRDAAIYTAGLFIAVSAIITVAAPLVSGYFLQKIIQWPSTDPNVKSLIENFEKQAATARNEAESAKKTLDEIQQLIKTLREQQDRERPRSGTGPAPASDPAATVSPARP